MIASKTNIVQLRLFKDIPEKVVPCGLCNGKGAIFREQTKVRHTAVYTGYWQGSLERREIEVETIIGGIDACPECAARAEAEYRARK